MASKMKERQEVGRNGEVYGRKHTRPLSIPKRTIGISGMLRSEEIEQLIIKCKMVMPENTQRMNKFYLHTI